MPHLLQPIRNSCGNPLEIKTRKMKRSRDSDNPRYLVCLQTRRHRTATAVQSKASTRKNHWFVVPDPLVLTQKCLQNQGKSWKIMKNHGKWPLLRVIDKRETGPEDTGWSLSLDSPLATWVWKSSVPSCSGPNFPSHYCNKQFLEIS